MKAKVIVTLSILALVVPFVLAQQAQQERQAQPDIQQRTQERQAQPSMQQQQERQGQERQPGAQAREQQDVDQIFLKSAMQGALFEQQAAKTVAERAQNEQVKEFAQTLQEQHKQAAQQYRQAAQQQQMEIPNQMENWQQELVRSMRQMDPQALETCFLFSVVGNHHKDILMHRWAAEKGRKEQVKQVATRQLPTLQRHLQRANQITQQVTGVRAEPMGVAGR